MWGVPSAYVSTQHEEAALSAASRAPGQVFRDLGPARTLVCHETMAG